MATLLFSNNATSNLAGAISNVATTINLTAGSGVLFPVPGANQYFKMTFIDAATGLLREIVHVTQVTGDVMTIVRAQEGTTARGWLAGDLAVNMWTAGSAAAMAQQANLFGAYVRDTGTANSIVITIPNNPTSLAALTGVPITVSKINATNTGDVFVTANNFAATPLFTPAGNNTFVGGELLANSTFTIVFDGGNWILQSQVAGVVAGGTGRTVGLTAHATLVGNGDQPVTLVSPGPAGSVYISNGPAADPSYGSIGVAGGGTGQTSLTTHALLIGEGTNAVAFAVPGTAGMAAISNGPNNDPSFQALSLSGAGVGGVLGVGNGGTGRNYLGQGVLVGEGGSAIDAVPYGTAGQPLISQGATIDPTFGPINFDTGGAVTGVLGVDNGGTGAASFGTYDLIAGNGAGPLIGIGPGGTPGVPLVSAAGGGFPFFNPVSLNGPGVNGVLPVSSGGTGVTSFTPYSVIVGNTTSTGTLVGIGPDAVTGKPLLNANGGFPFYGQLNLSQGSQILQGQLAESFLAPFSNSAGNNGYLIFPSGLMLQWLVLTVPTNITVTYNFPIAFPNFCLSMVCSLGYNISYPNNEVVGAQPISNSQFDCTNLSANSGSDEVLFLAIGY